MNFPAQHINSSAACTVRHKGVVGQCHVDERGDFVFKPQQAFKGGLLQCLRRSPDLVVIPAAELLGACLPAQSSTFRVWHCRRVTSGGGGQPVKVQYKLIKSARFVGEQRDATAEVVQRLRRVSWWGRDTPPHLALIMNPKSGRGKTASIVESVLLPMLRTAAGLRVTVHATQRPLHASEIMADMDFGSVDGVVFAGGDGTVHEGIQGLLGRSDWESAASMPFAAVPTGSGNGLAASVGHWDCVTAAFAVTRGRTAPLDMASILQAPQRRTYIFLSLVFGIMSNLDIGTEGCRWMGEPRFTLGGLREVLFRNKAYPAHVAFVRAEDDDAAQDRARLSVSISERSNAAGAEGPPIQATSTLDEHLLSSHASSQRHQKQQQQQTQQVQQKQAQWHATTAPNAGAAFRVADVPDGPPLPLLSSWPELPARLRDLPPQWEALPSTAIHFFAVLNTQYLALKARTNPAGCLNSGSLDLIYMLGPVSRLDSLQVLLQADSGDYVKLPFVHSVKVKALILEPQCLDTWVVEDGEAAPLQTLFLEVHRGLCRTFVAPEFQDPSVPMPTAAALAVAAIPPV